MFKRSVLILTLSLIVILSSASPSYGIDGEYGTLFINAVTEIGEEILGAEVYLDGVFKGYTPVTLTEVKAGEHLLEVKIEGQQPWSGTIEVMWMKVTEIKAYLAPLVQKASVVTEQLTEKVPQEISPVVVTKSEMPLVMSEEGQTAEVEEAPRISLLETILIPGGEFIMGSDEDDPDEYPRRKVYVDPFSIGNYEVTNAEYKVFIDDGGYYESQYWTEEGWKWRTENNIIQPRYWEYNEFYRPDYPVIGVSWYEAYAYAKWAGKRLPTEAEWEKAARGVDGRRWPWGNEWDCSRGNFDSEVRIDDYLDDCKDHYILSAPVGSFPSGVSYYGVYDMAGNAWEWVNDWYDPYSEGEERNPTGPASGEEKVVRGGSWDTTDVYVRCSKRAKYPPWYRDYQIGFRCAK